VLDPGEPTATQGADGYRFTDLLDDFYTLRVLVPPGYRQTLPAAGAAQQVPVHLDTTARAPQPFGLAPLPTGSIMGTVYNDANDDGVRGFGEDGMAGWTVYVDLNNNQAPDPGEPSRVTANGGVYTVFDVPAGTHTVRTARPAGWDYTDVPVRARTVTVVESQTTDAVDFATPVHTGDIVVTAYEDANGNGVRDAGEPPLAGWRFYSDANRNGAQDAGEFTFTTDASGTFVLNDFIVGRYMLREVPPVLWHPTSPATGAAEVTVSADQATQAPFGNARDSEPGSISGTVYNDADLDRTRDAGEAGLANRRVYLDANFNGLFDAGDTGALTGPGGSYSFTGLAPGGYYVRELLPAGWMQTTPSSQFDYPKWHTVTVAGRQDVSGVDFGTAQASPGSISGRAYYDANFSGTYDAGEPLTRNVNVFLDADNDGHFDNVEWFTSTAADGTYRFDDLLPGTYTVRQVVFTDYVQTEPAGSDALGHDAGHVVTLASGQSVGDANFGILPESRVGRIAGFVFDDANANGARDTGENALVRGRVVYLDANNNATLDAGERSFTTQVDGYWFNALTPGTYTVRAVVPAGLQQTFPAGGAAQVLAVTAGQTARGDFGLAPAPQPVTVTLGPVADAYVRDGASANTRYGAAAELQVKKSSAADLQRETYVRFDLSEVGAVTTAKLRLYGGLQSASGESITIGAYPVSDVIWPENDVTWATKPAAGSAPLSSQAVSGTAPQWYEWDVSDYLRQQKAAGAAAVSFALKGAATSSAYVRFNSDEAADPATRPQLVVEQGSRDTVAPTVREVVWRGSGWAPELLSFLSGAGMGDGGYRLPGIGAAGRTLPWLNPNTVTVRFSEDVRVQQDDLRLRGAAFPAYAILGFAYDPATSSATWTFAPDAATDRLTLELDGDGAGAVTDAAGNKLNGAADYVRTIELLAGDATGDGVVNALDIAFVKNRLNRTTADAGFSPFADVNGDGRTNALDVAAVKQRLTRRLPAPALLPAGRVLFSSREIDLHDDVAALLR
jgi:hypothetical protein